MAINLKQKFALDVERQVTGARMDLGDGAYFLIARWGNKEHNALMERLREPYKDRLELGGKLTDKETADITNKGIAGAILIGWGGISGVIDGAGDEEVPYSQEMAVALLADEEMESLRNRIITFSMSEANYRKSALQVTEKNSAASSNGKKRSART